MNLFSLLSSHRFFLIFLPFFKYIFYLLYCLLCCIPYFLSFFFIFLPSLSLSNCLSFFPLPFIFILYLFRYLVIDSHLFLSLNSHFQQQPNSNWSRNLNFFSLSLFHLQWRPTLPLHSVVSRLHETHNLAEMKTSITFILSLRACCKRGVIVTKGVCVVVWLKRNILYQIHLKSYYHRQLWGRFNQQAQLHASAAEKRRIESDLHSPTDRRHFGKCWCWQEKEWRRKHIPDGVCVVRINVTDL